MTCGRQRSAPFTATAEDAKCAALRAALRTTEAPPRPLIQLGSPTNSSDAGIGKMTSLFRPSQYTAECTYGTRTTCEYIQFSEIGRKVGMLCNTRQFISMT